MAYPQAGFRRLRRGLRESIADLGYDPQAMMARRAAVSGYGEGLSPLTATYLQHKERLGMETRGRRERRGVEERAREERLGREERAIGRTSGGLAIRRPKATQLSRVGKYPGSVAMGGFGRRRIAPTTSFAKEALAAIPGQRKKEFERLSAFALRPGGRGRWPWSRAKGGQVTKKPYLVGEEGPELFVPDTKGTIIPNPKTQKKMKKKSLYIPRRQGGRVYTTAQREKLRQLKYKRQIAELEGDITKAGPPTKIRGTYDPLAIPEWQRRYTGVIGAGARSGLFGRSMAYVRPILERAAKLAGPTRIREEIPRAPTQYPGGGEAEPSLQYERWLKRKYGRR